MKLICKTRGGENPRDMYRIFLSAHPDEYRAFVDSIIPEIHKSYDAAVFSKDDPTEPIPEELLSDFNLVIVSVSEGYLTENNIARDSELKAAFGLKIPVLPILETRNMDIEYAAYFGALQYLPRFKTGGGSIEYEEKLALYLSERITPTPLIRRITDAFSATFFLSYRKADRVAAQEIIRLIHSNPAYQSIAIWYDEYLTLGENFDSSIRSALDKSAVFLLAVTKRLVGEDNYVSREEYPLARDKGIPLFPIMLEEVEEHLLGKRFPNLPELVSIDDGREITERIGALMRQRGIESPKHCADHLIALGYFLGIYLEKNADIAISIFKRCAKHGNADSIAILADIYRRGEGVEKNLREAIKYQKRLLKIRKRVFSSTCFIHARREYAESLLTLLEMYIEGGYFPKAFGCAKRILDLNSECHIEKYKTDIFEPMLELYGFSDNSVCTNIARYNLPKADIYPIAALMYRLASMSEGEEREKRAKDYYAFLTEHRDQAASSVLEKLIKDYLPDMKPPKSTDGGVCDGTVAELSELPCDDTSIEPIIPLPTEGATDGGTPPFERNLADCVLPHFGFNARDTDTHPFAVLGELISSWARIKLCRYSPTKADNGIEKADVFSRYLAAREAMNLSGDFDEAIDEWLLNVSIPYKNPQEAKRIAEIYERVLHSSFNVRELSEKLSVIYSYLSECEPHNYKWIQKLATMKLDICRANLSRYTDTSPEQALAMADEAYRLLKRFARVSVKDDYEYELALAAFAIGDALFEMGEKEKAEEGYSEALDILVSLEKKRKDTVIRGRIKLALCDRSLKGDEGLNSLDEARADIEALPEGEMKEGYLARLGFAEGDYYMREGDIDKGLLAYLNTANRYAELSDRYGDAYTYGCAEAFITVAEKLFSLNEVREDIKNISDDAIRRLTAMEKPTYMRDLLLARAECLKGWFRKTEGGLENALTHFERAESLLEGIPKVKEISSVHKYLLNCYRGLYQVHRSLGNRKRARTYLGKSYKVVWKKETVKIEKSFFDIYGL